MGETTDADAGTPATTADDVLSVRQLNERISGRLDAADGLQSVQCLAEVTDLSQSNAAVYFSLTDGECELPCMLWQNRYQNKDVDLEDDQEVVLEGSIDYWVEGGRVRLKPWQVTVVGDGDQAAALERLRAELDDRGRFDEQHKTDPPRFPDRMKRELSTPAPKLQPRNEPSVMPRTRGPVSFFRQDSTSGRTGTAAPSNPIESTVRTPRRSRWPGSGRSGKGRNQPSRA